MTRIVTTTYRYKRPPRKRKPVAIEMPMVVKAADPAKTAKTRRVAKPDRATRSDTDAVPAPPANDDRKSRIVTTRKRGKRFEDLYAITDEEVQRRGDAADELFRELVRRATGKDQRDT